MNLATGLLEVLAGAGALGFSGDGGPATDATFRDIRGIGFVPSTGAIIFSDTLNLRIRSIAPETSAFDLVIALLTDQAFLDSVTSVAGSVLMINVDGRELLVVPNMTLVGTNVAVSGNDQLLIIDMSALQSVGGSVTITGNLSLTTIDLSSLSSIAGSLTITDNPNLNVVLLGGVTSIDGDLTIIGTEVDVINLPSLTNVGGNVTVSNNAPVTQVTMANLANVDGNVTVIDNGDTTVDMTNLANVGGNVTIENTGAGTFDADVCAAGSTDIDATGYATVSAKTADGETTSVRSTDDSSITVELEPATFESCVGFTVTRVQAAPEGGADAEGAPATIDPIDAYEIVFNVSGLGAPAELTFEIILANLEPARQAQVLQAVTSGTLTLVTKDGAGTYQEFHVCSNGEEPSAGGCVKLETLDDNGAPTTGTVATVCFTALVSHFSTWAVAIVTPLASRFGRLFVVGEREVLPVAFLVTLRPGGPGLSRAYGGTLSDHVPHDHHRERRNDHHNDGIGSERQRVVPEHERHCLESRLRQHQPVRAPQFPADVQRQRRPGGGGRRTDPGHVQQAGDGGRRLG